MEAKLNAMMITPVGLRPPSVIIIKKLKQKQLLVIFGQIAKITYRKIFLTVNSDICRNNISGG